MNQSIDALAELYRKANRVAFLGGAGLSTESSIPDFRSENGIYNAVNKYGYPPETLLSHSFYRRHPEIFYRYYIENLIFTDAQPNAAHHALARMEWGTSYDSRTVPGTKPKGKLTAVITQNIDNLHFAAGSRNVLELHGSVYRNYCENCGKSFAVQELTALSEKSADGIPRCECGGQIKPDVVLYEEGLDSGILRQAVAHIGRADLLIIGGTSLAVYPAAGLCDYFTGSDIVVINLSETMRETGASLTIREPIGRVLKSLVDVLSPEELNLI